MSTYAPATGEHAPPWISDTLIDNRRGTPTWSCPEVGSERMSWRLSFSSTQNGPSVSLGVVTQSPSALPVDPSPRSPAAPAAPSFKNRRRSRNDFRSGFVFIRGSPFDLPLHPPRRQNTTEGTLLDS